MAPGGAGGGSGSGSGSSTPTPASLAASAAAAGRDHPKLHEYLQASGRAREGRGAGARDGPWPKKRGAEVGRQGVGGSAHV